LGAALDWPSGTRGECHLATLTVVSQLTLGSLLRSPCRLQAMAGDGAPANDSPPAGSLARQRRLWGVRLVVIAATAAALGVPQSQLAQSQAAGTSIARLAARQNVSVARVRSVALAAADPLLDEAVRAGAISDSDRRSLRSRIRDRGVV